MYDKNNIFAKILRGEIECNKVYEDETCLFFYDIRPIAKVHVLGIPKVDCSDFSEFIKISKKDMVSNFFEKVEHVVSLLKLHKSGYKIITNSGSDGGQEVPHFHVHILGGEKIGLRV